MKGEASGNRSFLFKNVTPSAGFALAKHSVFPTNVGKRDWTRALSSAGSPVKLFWLKAIKVSRVKGASFVPRSAISLCETIKRNC